MRGGGGLARSQSEAVLSRPNSLNGSANASRRPSGTPMCTPAFDRRTAGTKVDCWRSSTAERAALRIVVPRDSPLGSKEGSPKGSTATSPKGGATTTSPKGAAQPSKPTSPKSGERAPTGSAASSSTTSATSASAASAAAAHAPSGTGNFRSGRLPVLPVAEEEGLET
eukprot:7390291-Prymnesium_polylepis.1